MQEFQLAFASNSKIWKANITKRLRRRSSVEGRLRARRLRYRPRSCANRQNLKSLISSQLRRSFSNSLSSTPNMRNILCFGDSNTWGYVPITGERFPHSIRWTGVLREHLGKNYWVIEEGLNGRTTVHNEEERPFRSGREILPAILESHRPLDLAVIMLGTNDLKSRFHSTPQDISIGVKSVCENALDFSKINGFEMQVLLVSPPCLNDMPKEDQALFSGATEKSLELAHCYESVAEALEISFLDAGEIVKTNTLDGVHWDAMQHKDFGKALSDLILTILE